MSDESRPERPRVFVTLGDGLAAGFGPWQLSAAGRRTSFPARLARRFGVPFQQPASSAQEVLSWVASTGELVLPHHLAVPGVGFCELFERRASTPILRAEDPLTTAINLVLGIPHLLRPGARPLCLMEAAASHRPTHVLISFGYDRALHAARARDVGVLSTPTEIEAGLERMARALDGAHMAVTSTLDPFNSPALAAIASGQEARGIRARIQEQNETLRQWSEDADAVFLDLDSAFAEATKRPFEPDDLSGGLASDFSGDLYRDLYGADGFYPNAACHHRIAVFALSRLALPWHLPEPAESAQPTQATGSPEPLEKASGRSGHSTPMMAWTPAPDANRGLKIQQGAEEYRALESQRELTLQLEAESSFALLALIDAEPGAPAAPGWLRPEELLGGPALGIAPLSGVVELRLGPRDASGCRRLILSLPVPLRAAAESHLSAPQLLRVGLDDIELHPLFSISGQQGEIGRVQAFSGGVQVKSSFLDAIEAANDAFTAPEVEMKLELPPREGSGLHVDLRVRATWTLPPRLRLPIPVAGGWRLLPAGAAKLLLFIRLTTRSEVMSEAITELRREPPRPALGSLPRQVDLPTLSILDGHYDLRAEELGGAARDSRRLLGLTRLDMGEPVGRLQPVIVTLDSPMIGRGSRRLIGFDGEVRFPNRLWRRRLPSWQHRLPSLGVVDRQSGKFLGGVVLAARSNGLPAAVECRMDADARLADDGMQLRFELAGEAQVSLEAGTPFSLSGATGSLTERSYVDFRLRLEATGGMNAPRGTISGEERLLSTSRQLFSFRYVLPPQPGERTLFEYTNHSAGGFFQLTCPLRLLFARSPGSRPGRTPDTVILEGLGLWSARRGAKGGEIRHVIFVSRRSRVAPYVAILIDGGAASNVEAGEA